ncbi:MAG: PdxA family dehydrogenase [Thermoanaerobaculia bacterium]
MPNESAETDWRPLVIAEWAALEPLRPVVPGAPWERLVQVGVPSAERLAAIEDSGGIPVIDPVEEARRVEPGRSGPADAAGALAALDSGIAAVRSGLAAALVTAPVSKASIALHVRADFRGHTEYLALACGLERYGRDYLMAFLGGDLQVALLSTHLPLAEAIAGVRRQAIEEALACLARHAGGRIAVAGLNPHAGEGGLIGGEERTEIAPAVESVRGEGVDAHGPESPDSLFARARRGEFDWVLALYHDQGLVAVKTAAFGSATNWTLGLPFLRTSVDHGTAFEIAGSGRADATPLAGVIETTLGFLRGRLPRRTGC